MKKRKGGLWQKMMAVLLSAVLITGMVSNAVPMTVLAQEDGEHAQGTTNPETQKTGKPADSENTIPKDSDTGKPADSESTNPEDTDKDKPDGSENLNPGQPETGTPNGSENLNPGQPETGTPDDSENTNPEEPKDPDTEDKKDDTTEEPGSGTEQPDAGTGQETPEPGTEEEKEPGTVSGNDAETEPVAAPQIMMMAATPQADNIASGEGWALGADGRLTITSDIGMTGWIASRYTTHNGTPYNLLVTSAEITGVTGIGKDAFFGCENLTGSITLPEGVTSIGEYAFSSCPKLMGITIPEGVTDIGKTAFAGCVGLTGITIPGSVTSIGDSAFATCEGLTSITIPDTVISMGNNMFGGCSSLTSVTLPNNMTSISNYMFSNCSSLTSITIPQTVTAIGHHAFYGCSSLTNITIPQTVTAIEGSAFYGCSSLTSITIPQIVTVIRGSTFYGCSSLTSITIPQTVTAIEGSAFEGCASLESITFLSDTPPTLESYVFGYDYSYGGTYEGGADERCGFVKGGQQGIHVPDGKAETYRNAADKGWGDWADYIADSDTPAEKHEHNGVNFTAWDKTDSLPTAAGNYYLTKDVTLSAAWLVPDGTTTLCLNGKTITQTTAGKRVIDIARLKTFTLYDCGEAGKITGGSSLGSIYIDVDADFYMYGGNISGNRGNDYGAVSVYGGTFHMCGGKISDNQNNVSSDINRGGGVYVSSGTFYMEGGEISDNSCSNGYGGGVSLSDSTFYMSGGKISGNTNGIYVSDNAEFHMSGGEVSGNTGSPCGGIQLDGKMTAGGNIVITGNKNDEGKDKNLFISSGTFNIDPDNPLGFANIGVTTDAKPTEENPVNITGVTNGNYIPCFHSDNADYEIKIGEYNKVQLVVKAATHVHNLTRVDTKDATCTENGNTAYYICDGENGCDKWFSDETGTQEITDKNSVIIPATGHIYDESAWDYQGTDGHAHKCQNCEEHDTVHPHTPGAAATAETPQTCTECGYIIAPATGHICSPQVVGKIEPGCTTAGKQAYYHCEGCEKNYEDAAGTKPITDISAWGIIAAQGHNWGEWTVTKSATAATPGEKERICKRCQQKETETIPATGSGGDKPGGEDKPGGDTPGGEDKPGGNKPGGNKPGSGNSGENSGGADDNASGNPGENESSDGDGQNSNASSGNGSSGGNNGSKPGAGAAAPTPGSSRTGQPKVKQEKEGNIQKEVRVEGAETLDAAVATPLSELADIVLTKEEKQQAAAGTNIRIVLEVKDAPAAVSATDKALVEKALNSSAARGYTLGQYLDINLYKVVGDSRSAIAETDRKITITIDVPDSLRNTDGTKTRTFAVIRAHAGRAELLADLDVNADTITIETDRFSTYAVVYKDTTGENGDGNQSVNGKPGVVRVSTKSDGKNPGGGKDNEPKTEDRTPIELSATLAMIAGLTYLLLYFANLKHGMTEEAKKELVSRLVVWAKQGGKGRTYLALAAIFVLLVYYHSIGKKMCVEWEEVYGD